MATVGSGSERPTEGVSSKQTHQSCVSLPEWRSCEQVENGTPSVSPPYWDNDDDDDEGPKPLELYRKHTWKIDKFSKISKRELKSDTFEVGGYKWYILIYPQGCDVCNHLSLFLCVADHDKLLPAWRQFAQFTIAVVNKDPKKSKYSDTLHCFWKKEHDWGWKKFMELSKLLDGFIDNDTLIIKAQVQVIRYREDRPFRCLGSPYRREIVRVYLANVEQICRHFAEERQAKIRNLIDDEARWSSFRAFWLCKDQNSRHRMSREKTEPILKLLVKHFFIEKEVTSTLVMDSIYNGLKALEGQHKGKINKDEYLETEELPIATVRKENNTFVLVDDVLTLLERAAIEPLPPKDEKAPQNRTKDGSLGEDFNKDLTERDERRLTELGRRTIEIFTLAHIFSKIDVSYQEAVSLQRQEELIREEEEAWLARRDAADKEKKSKKKQGKNKRNNRKGKDKGRNDNPNNNAQVEMEQDTHTVERKDSVETTLEKFNDIDDIVSIASDSLLCAPEVFSEDKDTDTSEVHPPTEASNSGIGELPSLQNGSSMVDDSSSTCSSDSVPFVAVNGSRYRNNRRSPSRSMDHQSKLSCDFNGKPSQSSKPALDVGRAIDKSGSSKAVQSASHASDRVVNVAAKRMVKEEVSRDQASSAVYLPKNPPKNIIHPPTKNSSPETHNGKQAETSNSAENNFPSLKKSPTPYAATKPKKLPAAPVVISRPLSAPLIPVSTPPASMTPKNQAVPILPRSASSDGRSYRNAIVGSVSREENMPFLYSSQAPNLSFGSVSRPSLWTESSQSGLTNDVQSLDLYNSVGPSPDEFPHLDIINDLLDEEHGMGNLSVSHSGHQGLGFGLQYLNQHVRFPGDLGGPRFDMDNRFHHGYGLVPHSQWQMDPPFVGFGSGDPYAYQHPPSVGANGYMVFRPPSGL